VKLRHVLTSLFVFPSLASLAPRGKIELSQSMTNLSTAPQAAPKTGLAGNSLGLGKRNGYSASTSALFPQGKRRKKLTN